MTRFSSSVLVGLFVACALASSPSANSQPSPVQKVDGRSKASSIEKLQSKHLQNPVRVHEKLISGGLPEGDEAFAELQQMGIKTIISVDGSKPDVARARKYGMRYVHLPHGYDGVPVERAKELAKAVRDLPGPFYLHCHQGKHRSPAASAVACVGAGLISREDAMAVLKIAGTSDAYRGLFQSVTDARRLDESVLDQLKIDFQSVAKVPAMAEAMVEIERHHERLKDMEKNGWAAPLDQPALVPDHEALLLREQFTELLRTKEVQDKPARFQQLSREAELASQALEDALKTPDKGNETGTKLLATVSNNCKSCHQAFRDVPLREKETQK